MKRRITVLVLALLALPAAASADPAREAQSGVTPHMRSVDHILVGPVESRLPALGTDVAAPDQQASPRAAAPATPAGDSGGLDWSDAGIGAAGLLGVAAAGLAGGITVRKRQQRRAALAG